MSVGHVAIFLNFLGVERGQRSVGVVNLHRLAESLGMSLSELFAEMESGKGRDGD